MEFRDLSYFLVVASVGNMGRAAVRLKLTQPALTKSMVRLEKELAVPLFDRTAKGVSLTLYGHHLLQHAERLRAADVDIRRELTELSTGHAGHIRIGTGMVLAQYVLPRACISLLDRYPGITLEISAGNTETLFPALRDRRLDVVLTSIGPEPAPGFKQVFLARDKVAVITRKGHRLQRMHHLNPKTLSEERWAMPAAHTAPAEWLMQRCRDLGIHPLNCAVRTGTLPTLLRVVADTDLVAFQSWPVIRRTKEYGDLLRPLALEELTWCRDVGATIRDHGYISPAVEKLVEVLREVAAREAIM